ncbi:thioredoxin family protein [Chryseobacterium sp. LC2016-27]|jgi:peroxiredoxin|uniref:thioredoxin family protein n=1 Tax=Chryseobacterium sp. LC2016-27 TaxID=2897326 RepID=UPI001E4F985B|nr:thioredoxin family protein [Chryseobacterium sp. LC2016-27]MCD0454339.1 thioredoxin family protein [Chryseobacterium sp. LC2016-27]
MKHIKTLLTATIIGFSLLSFTAFNKNNEEPKQKVSASKGYEVGDTAADFKLKNIDGKMVSLSDFKKAKGFIVVFTCNHCPYAKKYEDRIVALDKKYKEVGYPVIAINPNDPNVQPEDGFQQMITRAKEKGFTFPYLVDEGQKVYPQYGATKTPHVFILQKEGKKNIVKYIGAIDNNYDDPNDVSEHYVEDAMDALLNGKAVANTKTVAIGCTIKVKK